MGRNDRLDFLKFARRYFRAARSCVLVLVGCLILYNLSCTAPGDKWAEVIRQLPERGLKPKNVSYSSTTGLQGQGQLSGGSTPPSGSGSASVAEVTSTTVTFDTVPINDPAMSAKFGIESVNPNADTDVVLIVNGVPASMVSDAADSRTLAAAYGGHWHVFATGTPVTLGAKPGQADRVFLALERSESLSMPAAGTPFPTKATTRVAFQLAAGQWGVFPSDDPIKSDNILISPLIPSPLRIKRGTQTTLSDVWVKNATPNSLNVALTAQFTQKQNVVAKSNIGSLALGGYDLKSLHNVVLATQGLQPGVYTLVLAGTSGTTQEGSTEIIVEIMP